MRGALLRARPALRAHRASSRSRRAAARRSPTRSGPDRGEYVFQCAERALGETVQGLLDYRGDLQEGQTALEKGGHGDLVGRAERGRRGPSAPERRVGEPQSREALEIGLLEGEEV